MVKNLFLSGTPGVGKTSLVREVTLPYRGRVGGFYTEQMLEGGHRLGFRIVSFQGGEAVLASKGWIGTPGAAGAAQGPRVRFNKYTVDLGALERVGVSALEAARASAALIVIDEVGSMEVLSDAFRSEVLACLATGKPILATIRRGARPFSEEVLRMDQTRLLELRRHNYAQVKREVQTWLAGHLGPGPGCAESG